MDLLVYSMFNFATYSFIGWVIEELYCYWVTGNFKTDGFLMGPFKPMYGVTGVLLVIISRYYDKNLVLMLILCFLIPSIVEGVSGYILQVAFSKQYWDYSILKYNFHGLVSLKFSLYWMALSFIGIYYIQPIIYSIYNSSFKFWIVGIPVITSLFIGDLILTVKKLIHV